MRRRGCLISFGALAGLTLICCIVGWFVGVPWIQDEFADELNEGLSTQVAQQLDSVGGEFSPGVYTIDVSAIEQELANLGSLNTDDLDLSVADGQISLQLGQSGQQVGYSGTLTAANGELVVTDMESTDNFFNFLLSPDRLANAIENSVNSFFEARGLEIAAVTAENNELVIETTEAAQ